MPSLDDLRRRISSVKSTQKITKAMKMVAAAKLRRAQKMAEQGRSYSDKMDVIIQNLSKAISDPSNVSKLLAGTGEDKTHLCVVMTADRGLCGSFNTNICKLAKNYFNEIIKKSKNLKIIAVGTKGFDQLKRNYGRYIIKKVNFKDKKKLSFRDAEAIGREIVKLFKNKEFDFVISSHVIEHVEDFEFFLKELERISTKGYIELPTRLGDNLVFENKTDHIWWFTYDDTNNLIIASKRNQLLDPFITVAMAKIFEKIFRESLVIELAWEERIEYKIDNKIREEDFKKISFFKLIRKYFSKKTRSLFK